MGIVSFPGSLKPEIMAVCNAEDGWFPLLYLFSGMLRRPFMRRSQKTYEKET